MLTPAVQMGSPGIHMSIVFPTYSGPMPGIGSPPDNRLANEPLSDGFPNTATAATLLATLAGISPVARSITSAPCEYPPSTILVLGQLAAMFWTWPLVSLAPAADDLENESVAGEFTGYTPTDLPPTWDVSESMNACPTPPTPGGSFVPRANTTSTSGHGAAAAEGTVVAVNAEAVTAAAPRRPASWRAWRGFMQTYR